MYCNTISKIILIQHWVRPLLRWINVVLSPTSPSSSYWAVATSVYRDGASGGNSASQINHQLGRNHHHHKTEAGLWQAGSGWIVQRVNFRGVSVSRFAPLVLSSALNQYILALLSQSSALALKTCDLRDACVEFGLHILYIANIIQLPDRHYNTFYNHHHNVLSSLLSSSTSSSPSLSHHCHHHLNNMKDWYCYHIQFLLIYKWFNHIHLVLTCKLIVLIQTNWILVVSSWARNRIWMAKLTSQKPEMYTWTWLMGLYFTLFVKLHNKLYGRQITKTRFHKSFLVNSLAVYLAALLYCIDCVKSSNKNCYSKL